LDLDPFPIVIRELVSEYEKKETLTRLIIQLCRGYLVVIWLFGIFRLLLVIPAGLLTLIDMIQNLLQLVNEKLESNTFWVNLKWNLICYNKLVICINVLQFVEIIALFLMEVVMLVIVLFNFIIIRMYNSFPFLVWCFPPVLNMILIVGVQVTIPQCVAFANDCAKWKAHLIIAADERQSPYMRKRTRAMFPLRVNVGVPGYIILYSILGRQQKCHTMKQ